MKVVEAEYLEETGVLGNAECYLLRFGMSLTDEDYILILRNGKPLDERTKELLESYALELIADRDE